MRDFSSPQLYKNQYNDVMLTYTKAFSGFSVPNIKEAQRFYAETLGLGVKETPQGLELQLGSGQSVFIYSSPTNKPADFTVLNFVVDDVDQAVDALGAQGVMMIQYDMPQMKTDTKGVLRNNGAHPGPKAIAWFKDPSGNILSIIQEK